MGTGGAGPDGPSGLVGSGGVGVGCGGWSIDMRATGGACVCARARARGSGVGAAAPTDPRRRPGRVQLPAAAAAAKASVIVFARGGDGVYKNSSTGASEPGAVRAMSKGSGCGKSIERMVWLVRSPT
jgi:hypothetical protein